jgi:hypothetical protein
MRQQIAVGPDHCAGRHRAQGQALALGHWRELGDQLAKEREQRHGLDGRGEHAGIELGDGEERVQQPLDRPESGLDALDQARRPDGQVDLRQCRDEEAGGMERLKKIMQGAGQRAGLRQVGRLGFEPGPGQRLMAAPQLGERSLQQDRPLADLALEQDGLLEQGERGALKAHAALDPPSAHP